MDTLVAAAMAAAVGFVFAWFVRSARAQAELAPVQARADSLELQHAKSARVLDALKGAHLRAVEQHGEESQRRAAAEQGAVRIPDLESKLIQHEQALARSGARRSRN